MRAGALLAGIPIGLAAPAPSSAHVRGPAAGAAPRSCAPNLADQLHRTAGASELVTVEASSYATTSATLTAWRRVGRCFSRVSGPFVAEVGRSGLSDHHLEGDGTTPTGAYRVGPTMYGVAADPGVAYRYDHLKCGDWWDEDPSSPGYNTFRHLPCGTTPEFGGDSEALWTEAPAYDHFAVIEYNTHPAVAGRGSGIFLHVSTGAPTDGCVSLPEPQLDRVLRWLRPDGHPLVVIGASEEIRRF